MIFNDIIRRIRKGVNSDMASKKYGGVSIGEVMQVLNGRARRRKPVDDPGQKRAMLLWQWTDVLNPRQPWISMHIL